MAWTVRAAGEPDADAVAGLLAQLGYPRSAADVTRALRDPGQHVLVGVDGGGEPLGVIVASARWTLHQGAVVGTLDALVVDEAHRSMGLGEALVGAAIATLRREGARRVELHSNHRRVRAHAFYEHLGFRETSKFFVIDVTVE
jgi:ribosomal protein S18 acetylase RimI-like enzyme